MLCHPAEISGVTLQIVVSFEERERKIHRDPAFFFFLSFQSSHQVIPGYIRALQILFPVM